MYKKTQKKKVGYFFPDPCRGAPRVLLRSGCQGYFLMVKSLSEKSLIDRSLNDRIRTR